MLTPSPTVARSALLSEMAATLLGTHVGFWDPSSIAEFDELSRSVDQVLGGDDSRQSSPDELTPTRLAGVDEGLFGSDPTMFVVPHDRIVDGFAGRSVNPRWSPSILWLHGLVRVCEEIVANGHVFPSVRPHGLRWTASWSPIADPGVERHLQWLIDVAPPVVLAGSAAGPVEQLRSIVAAVVDTIARRRLSEREWRPPLARSRSASVVALRRLVSALSGDDHIFIGDSPTHEAAFARWSTATSEAAHLLSGGIELTFRARLVPPPAESESVPWLLTFEVVDADGRAASFEEVWTGAPEAEAILGEEGPSKVRLRMTELVSRLGGQIDLFSPLLDQRRPTELALDVDEVTELLDESLPACARAGLTVEVPSALRRRRARLTARATTPVDLPSGRDRGLISVDWGVALGDVELTAAELRELAESKAEIVAVRGEWLHIDRDELHAVSRVQDEHVRSHAQLTPAELIRRSITTIETPDDDLSAQGWIDTLLAGLPDDELTEAFEPAGFSGELRAYQRRALSWLQFLGRLGLGGCLADDMGLGKTPTALAHMLERTLASRDADSPSRPHLVVCPLSVVTNWAAEAERFAPQLSILIAHGPDRSQGDELVAAARAHDLVITTYGTVSRIDDELADVAWDVVVLDEAQVIKNHTTNAARSVRRFEANQRVALTGTPVENRLLELWAILDALNPGMLGGAGWFRTNMANPIETTGDPEKIESLRRLTAPFVLRRTKADRSLVPDLPDKIEQIAWSTLTPEQAGLYQAVVDEFTGELRNASGMARRGLVLATLTKLKQICNHPAHFLGESELGDAGEIRSGKLARFDELLDNILDADEKVLVFTQYRKMGDLLSSHLERRLGLDVPFLHGGTTLAKRVSMVDEFQSDGGSAVQLVSLRAGGTGLNLTAASRVIHYDRWWNPAVEDQATDRTWRIGQTRTVFAHKLVCRGTLEERIDDLLNRKRLLAETVVPTGDRWLTELSTDELRNLVQLDDAAVADR